MTRPNPCVEIIDRVIKIDGHEIPVNNFRGEANPDYFELTLTIHTDNYCVGDAGHTIKSPAYKPSDTTDLEPIRARQGEPTDTEVEAAGQAIHDDMCDRTSHDVFCTSYAYTARAALDAAREALLTGDTQTPRHD